MKGEPAVVTYVLDHAGTEAYEHGVIYDREDGEVEPLIRCGILHPQDIDWQDCKVASRWTLLNAD